MWKELNPSGECSENERGVILITFLSIKTSSIFPYYMACNECELKVLRKASHWKGECSWDDNDDVGDEKLVENKNNDNDEDWNAVEYYYLIDYHIINTHLLQLLLFGDEFLVESSSMLFALKKLSWKNFRKCGRFFIKLLFTSFSLSLIWLSNSKFVVAFDFDLYAVDGEFVRRHPVCEPNNPIMSNSYRICN